MDVMDSSDDEREPMEQKYNEFGRFVKDRLKTVSSNSESNSFDFYGNGKKLNSWKLGAPENKVSETESIQKLSSAMHSGKTAVMKDSFASIIGINVVNPLIMVNTLKEKLVGRNFIPFFKLKNHITCTELNSDWCIAGVIVSTITKVSGKGKNYCIWKLSDLKLDLKTVSLFLFGQSYKDLWKCTQGTVIGVLNPSVMESKKDASDEVVLSIFNADQVIVFGQSKDYGLCKSRKKDGDSCKQFVNKNHCEFCIYHVQKEHSKFSNSRFSQPSAKSGLTSLRNKVLGKNEVFYAGKSFTAIKPEKVKTKKVKDKDKKILSNLFGVAEFKSTMDDNLATARDRLANQQNDLKYSRYQKIKDAELLNRLSKESSSQTIVDENKKLNGPDKLAGAFGSKVLHDQNNGINTSLKTDTKKTSNLSASEFLNIIKNDKNISSDKSMKREKISFVDNKTNQSKISDKGKLELNLKKQHIPIKDEQNKSDKALTTKNSNESIDLSEFSSQSKLTDKEMMFLSSKKSSINLLSIVNKSENKMINKQVPINRYQKQMTIEENKVESPFDRNLIKNATVNKNNVKPVLTGGFTLKPTDSIIDLNSERKSLSALSNLSNNKLTDVSSPILNKRKDAAKFKALQFIKKNGPLNKTDPNSCKLNQNNKRKACCLNDSYEESKSENDSSVLSKTFIELMNKTSKHDDLIQEADEKCMDEYFQKMSKKEQMEEKMLNTYKLPCKAVRCLKCKYTWFSASDYCKQDHHPIRVVDAMKRFFKCNDCGNRTVTFDIIPLLSCKQCGHSNWQRAPLLNEKKTLANLNQLSIRGGEQKFINSAITDTNLNLLVPE